MTGLIVEISEIVSKFKTGNALPTDITKLQENIEKIVRNQPSIVILEYIENEQIKLYELHRDVDLNSANTFIFDNIETDLGGYVERFDLISGDGEKIITLNRNNLISIYSVLLDKYLNNSPLIENSLDYTQRDYQSAFNSVIEHIEKFSPDLAQLISSRSSPDFLLLDSLAFLYDRLQFYIDYGIANIDVEQARGKFLELIAKFYSVNIPIPSTSKLNISIVLKTEFDLENKIKSLLLTKGLNVLKIKSFTLKNSPFSTQKNKFTTTKGDFYFLDLPIYFDKEKLIQISNEQKWYSYITYEQMDVTTETFKIYDEAREHTLSQKYVNPNKINLTILNLNPSDYQIRLIYDINTFYKVINEAEQLKSQLSGITTSFFFLPVYVDINRLGIGKLIFMDSLLSNFPSELVVNISYGYHNGSLSNGAEFNDIEETQVIPKAEVNLFTEMEIYYYSTDNTLKNYTLQMKDIFENENFEFQISYSKYDKYELDKNSKQVILQSTNGTLPLTDEEIRSIILKSTTSFDTQTKLEHLKRAVVEEDYKSLLLQNNLFDVLSVKVIGYSFDTPSIPPE